MKRLLLIIAATAVLAACVPTEAPTAVNPAAPGFPLGVWHGFIFPLSFLMSLFTDDIAVYAVPNNGHWYDFGYFIGVCFLGVGARSTKRRGP